MLKNLEKWEKKILRNFNEFFSKFQLQKISKNLICQKKSVKRIPRNLEKCEKILEISKNPRNPINLEIIDVNLKIFAKLIKKKLEIA